MRLATGTLVLLAGISMSPSLSAQSLSRAERPELKVGDTWVYQRFDVRTSRKLGASTHVVEEVSDDTIVVRTKALDAKGRDMVGTNRYTRDWNLREVRAGDALTSTATPAWGYYKFPLEVGQQWDAKFDTTARGGQRTTRWQWKVRVEAVEKVSVLAGNFEAFKLRYEGYFDVTESPRRWSGTRSETLWYAPAVKRHVKFEYETRATWAGGGSYDHERVVLQSFEPGP